MNHNVDRTTGNVKGRLGKFRGGDERWRIIQALPPIPFFWKREDSGSGEQFPGFVFTQGQNLRVITVGILRPREWAGRKGGRERCPPGLSILPRGHLRKMLNEQQ